MKKIRWDLIGISLGIAIVLIAVVAVVTSGEPNSIYIAIGVIAGFGAMGNVLYKNLGQPMFNKKRLQKIGIPGKAKIVAVHETNIAINNNPQLNLVMEIKNNAGDVYTAECKTVVSKLKPIEFQPGKEVNVRIDPNNEKNVVLDIS
jgi:hypothetical protein